MVDKDVVRRGYDELAETYAAERSETDRERAALEAFFESLPASPTLLDAGCGQGTPVLRRGSEDGGAAAVGVDFSREQLELAAANAPIASLVRGDLTDLPVRDGTFDAVIALHSLIHVPVDDHRTVLEEFARVLRPGGRVLVSEGLEEWRGENPDWLETGVEMQWHVAGAATRTQLRETGFEIVDERGVSGTLREDERWVYVAGRLEK
ncbi:class I SAM-dependent methyltransferase [Haloterrigena sp. SYSU A558-1]|uniref:Class I SAM-dependent methyltransferase n=1 Tax=Haloterrigena gelatinilytica TaxID=2741724 RepID=A0A8J8GKB5_9EURY|nr:class I SAM-dependent methyltransferase [Haloterrigena gelatinilytica]NUB91579.1 class I SAM-dependent methyltransferase [Haloterrigena gelatinilytica]NUC72684.1 class I SAM-dependent methyltransferase [Haloterrigena gelatinilytica]